jgi:periplasmic protein TonB
MHVSSGTAGLTSSNAISRKKTIGQRHSSSPAGRELGSCGDARSSLEVDVRALALSLAASLGLHGGVLSVVSGKSGVQAKPEAPVVSLVEVSLAGPVDIAAADAAPGERSTTSSPVPRPRVAPSRSKFVAKRVPAELPAENEPAHEAPRSDDNEPAEGIDHGDPGPLVGASGTPGSTAACSTGETRPPGVHTSEAPTYPPTARQSGVQGTTRVSLLVSSIGTVTEAIVVRSSGSPALDNAAVAALLRWRFQPAVRSGEPVAAQVIVPVVFSLR